MRRGLFVVCFVAALLVAPARSTAAPVVIDFSVISTVGGPVTGTGSVLTDDSNLAPGTSTLDFTDLLDMSLTLNNIPDTPSTTTFTRANLHPAPNLSWILTTNGAGTIVDLNFFMEFNGTNTDGYSIEGTSAFTFVLCDGAANGSGCAGGNASVRDRLGVQVTSVHSAIPEPASLFLLGSGIVAVAAKEKRRKSQVQ